MWRSHCELDSSTPVGERGADEYAEKGLDVYDQLDAIAGAGLPVVWVVRAVGSRPDHECILGDGMAKELPFAVYARGTTNHHCPLRFRAFDRPVEVGRITIRPGDVISANSEGVIRIPAGCLEALPERATADR